MEGRTQITITENLSRLVDDVLDAISTHPDVYVRGGKLVQVFRGEAHELKAEGLQTVASACAIFDEVVRGRDGATKSKIRRLFKEEASAVLQAPNKRDVRRLEGIVHTPRLLPDGRLIVQPGYDAPSGLIYEPQCDWPEMPKHPTLDDAKAAYKALAWLFREFAFGDDHDWCTAAAIGCALTLQARYLFDGAAPLFIFDGSIEGAGKGLLARTVVTIGHGRRPASQTQQNNNETSKRIFSAAMEGREIFFIDNVNRPLGGAALCSAVTEPVIGGRVLGLSKTPEYPNKITFMASGINVDFDRAEMERRVLTIRQEPGPGERRFETNLDAYVSAHRTELTTHLITILRAYILADSPKQSLRTWDSFGAWSDAVRAPLLWLGAPDLRKSQEERAQLEHNYEREAQIDLVEKWRAVARDEKLRAAEIIDNVRIATVSQAPNGKAWVAFARAALQLIPEGDGASIDALNSKHIGAALGTLKGRWLKLSDGSYGRMLATKLHGINRWSWSTADAPIVPATPANDTTRNSHAGGIARIRQLARRGAGGASGCTDV